MAATVILSSLSFDFFVEDGYAEAMSVTADGVAVLGEKGELEARSAAIADGLTEAVRQAMGLMVKSTTLVENAQLVTDRIQTKTSGYVSNYRIVKERQDAGLYRVTLDVTVDRTHLTQDLEAIGLLYKSVGNPRFLVLVNDSFAGAALPDLVTEAEISRLLIIAGFMRILDGAWRNNQFVRAETQLQLAEY